MRFQGGRDTCIYDYIHYHDDDDDDVDDGDDDDDHPPLSKVRTWTSCEMVNYWFFDCLPQQILLAQKSKSISSRLNLCKESVT